MADLPLPAWRSEPEVPASQGPPALPRFGQTPTASPRYTLRSLLALVGVIVLASLVLASLLGLGEVGLRLAVRTVHLNPPPLRIPPLPQRSTIYASDGSVLGSVYLDFNREVVSLSHVNRITRHAVLAIEDHRFYT